MGVKKTARKGPRRDRGRERFWRGMVRRQKASGQSVRAFCAEHRLSEPSFYGWRSELKRRDEQPAGTTIASGVRPRAATRGSRGAPTLLPVRIVGSDSTAPARETSGTEASIEIVLRDDLRLRVGPQFQAEALARVLDVLEARPC